MGGQVIRKQLGTMRCKQDLILMWIINYEPYADEPGFCKAARVDEIEAHNCVLTPGRYVGAGAAEEDGEPFVEKFDRLTAELREQFAEGRRLEAEIGAKLGALV